MPKTNNFWPIAILQVLAQNADLKKLMATNVKVAEHR